MKTLILPEKRLKVGGFATDCPILNRYEIIAMSLRPPPVAMLCILSPTDCHFHCIISSLTPSGGRMNQKIPSNGITTKFNLTEHWIFLTEWIKKSRQTGLRRYWLCLFQSHFNLKEWIKKSRQTGLRPSCRWSGQDCDGPWMNQKIPSNGITTID